MCGIIGYAGSQDAVSVLMSGLERLEYRGYDSAGIACFDERTQGITMIKEKGKLHQLKRKIGKMKLFSSVGIGHTRWATHGEPSQKNAHPHSNPEKNIALVHNGIIENYEELREKLRRKGYRFYSETDTEVAVYLIADLYRGDLREALEKAVQQMTGFFAFVVLSKDHPDTLYAYRRSNPLVIGVGRDENFIASDTAAILPYTKKVIYMEDGELAVISPAGIRIFKSGKEQMLQKRILEIHWSVEQAQKGGCRHFMLKEIYEQPRVLQTIIETRCRGEKIFFDSLKPAFIRRLKKIERIHFVSCGTAYHAGLVGTYMFGECVHLPVEATVSSEFRYEDPVVSEKDLVILITQSGETADTLAALRIAREKKALTLAIVNVVGSTIAREADAVIYTHAGPEIGVASTKAYLAQLMTLGLAALFLGQIHPKKKLKHHQIESHFAALRKLPRQVKEVLKLEKNILNCAKDLYRKSNFLYLGRGFNYPNALEGALKLKEITYAHAHGYPAGEMKHGPIALIDSKQPVICICPKKTKTYDKMLSNIEEIKARRGIIISITSEKDKTLSKLSQYTFEVPKTEEFLSPILTVIPLQIMAYKIAVLNGRDVDQPRNLAKSVTVE